MPSDAIEAIVADVSAAAGQGGFSGVVVMHRRGTPLLEYAGGWADRAERRPMSLGTRLATASVTKGFTALAVASMIEEGRCTFDTALSDVVGDTLPAVDPGVTVRHLLGHTSGVGDYLDEDAPGDIDDHVLDVPVHRLEGPEDYVPILNRFPQREPPGSRFRYNNSGFVMLALVVERLGEGSYHDEVRRRVFAPAGMASSDFVRSDRPETDTALGYLRDGRTNVLHLPVVGTGDGGAYTTGPDMLRFWDALLAGRIVGAPLVAEMTTVQGESATGEPYGLGFWIGRDRGTVCLEGMDAGVSMRTGVDDALGLCYCLIANDSGGVWPLAKIIDRHLADLAGPI